MPKFEAHITVDVAQAVLAREVGELAGWKFSQIHGDAVMGEKPFAYLTNVYTGDHAGERLNADTFTLARVLEQSGVRVLREKVERIMRDTKTGLDEFLEGA